MATLTLQTLDRDGLNPSFASADVGGDQFANTGKEFVYLKNDDGSSKTVTLVIQATIDGQAVINRTVIVAATDIMLVGPFPVGDYNDSNDVMQLTYSDVTSLSVAAIQLDLTSS
jgi:hypothetical protein